jgi:predicted enzyme related to lactoylglutathione lyase
MIDARHALTILAVEDLSHAKEFYSTAFGWPLVVDVPAYAEFQLPAGMRLGLYDRGAFGHNTGRLPARTSEEETTATELYFYVDDLASALERMNAAGARELSPRAVRPWGDEAAYFADPAGNVVVLARPAP